VVFRSSFGAAPVRSCFHFLEKNPCEIIFNKATFAGFDLNDG
jgi:hypothetical protein